MGRTKRYLGWSRCPRHLTEGRNVLVNDDREIEDGCGLCEDEGLPEYTDDETAYVLNDAEVPNDGSVFGDLGRDTR